MRPAALHVRRGVRAFVVRDLEVLPRRRAAPIGVEAVQQLADGGRSVRPQHAQECQLDVGRKQSVGRMDHPSLPFAQAPAPTRRGPPGEVCVRGRVRRELRPPIRLLFILNAWLPDRFEHGSLLAGEAPQRTHLILIPTAVGRRIFSGGTETGPGETLRPHRLPSVQRDSSVVAIRRAGRPRNDVPSRGGKHIGASPADDEPGPGGRSNSSATAARARPASLGSPLHISNESTPSVRT